MPMANQLTWGLASGTDDANNTGTPGFSDLPTALYFIDRIGSQDQQCASQKICAKNHKYDVFI